jgi:hypothetical protein
MGDTGMTGSTGPFVLYPFPGVSGPTGPVYIMTLDELRQYHDTITKTETADKLKLTAITIPESSGIQPKLIEWATAGFPDQYGVLTVVLSPPSQCSDGQSRTLQQYIEFLTGSNIMDLTTAFQTKFLDMCFSYSISGNAITLHATSTA